MPRRSHLVSKIAGVVAALHPERVVRVGADGEDDAGKTVFADELAEAIPGGDLRYRAAAFDHWTDRPVESDWRHAPADAVLVVDGIFLHRPELREYWDFSIFLDVAFEVSISRGAQRGYGDPDPSAASNRRYVQGQVLDLDQCRPAERTSLVIDNVLDAPVFVRHHHSS